MAEAKKLTPEVAAKYNLIPGFGVGECQFKGQTIHLDKLSVSEAEELVKQGFNVLEEKKTAPATKA